MRHRGSRVVVLGLILAFPILVHTVSAPGFGGVAGLFSAGSPLLGVEMLLVGGLVFASRERRRLFLLVDNARLGSGTVPVPAPAPHLASAGASSPARRTVAGRLGR